MKFTNSVKYSPAANHYLELGFYTDAIPGTKEYYDYWDEQRKRCLEGYKDLTGYHYFYLNFCPIDRVVDDYLADGTKIARRDRTFIVLMTKRNFTFTNDTFSPIILFTHTLTLC